MAIRQKQIIREILRSQFTDHNLSLQISQKEYNSLLGQAAVHPLSIKKSFKTWKMAMHSLRTVYSQKPEPKPEPVVKKPTVKPAPKPKAPPAPSKPAPKAAPKSKD